MYELAWMIEKRLLSPGLLKKGCGWRGVVLE